jgi:hypothetical protein
MEFLFETLIMDSTNLIYYRIYRTGKSSYFAELINPEIEQSDFQFKKIDGTWQADHVANQKYADLLGHEVDIEIS